MLTNKFKMKSKVWLYQGIAGWHFLTLPKKDAVRIKKIFGSMAAGWGSLPVIVTIGKTSWKTSIFPDKKSDSYLLPLKAAIRKKEQIKNGDTVSYVVEVQT
ncbi:MAG TPA: DUF1905 domain-containing protein [Verrucomicrobiae bacterium]|nr:DUF1905 domain-containing protein [Verrucomicrobiae bacterium]